jgi:hypothetical protein
MIGGDGNLPAKMARTKSMPGIAAMMCVGVTPYSILGADGSCIEEYPVSDDGYHTIESAIPTVTLRHART